LAVLRPLLLVPAPAVPAAAAYEYKLMRRTAKLLCIAHPVVPDHAS
jgi:hypothetical protein